MTREELRWVICGPGCSRTDECDTMDAIDRYVAAERARERERALLVFCCARTGHPCGTDTYAVGRECRCLMCEAVAAARALPASESE